jgi:hypothetical protein
MTKNSNYISVAVLAIIILGLGFFFVGKQSVTAPPVAERENTTPNETGGNTTGTPSQTGGTAKPTNGVAASNTSGFSTYTNSNTGYNFTMKYPSYVKASTAFRSFYQIGTNWRLYAGQANQGTALVAFTIHNIDQGTYSTGKQSYPLYFTSEVRVGASPNTKECYTTDVGYPNQKVTDVTINGVLFRKFSTSDSAMMKYTQSESYRTIHAGKCFVIEQIRSGSSYRDDKMTPGVSDTALMNYYNLGETIVKTFTFTK